MARRGHTADAAPKNPYEWGHHLLSGPNPPTLFRILFAEPYGAAADQPVDHHADTALQHDHILLVVHAVTADAPRDLDQVTLTHVPPQGDVILHQ